MPTLFDSLALFLDREPHGAALNMAIDEVILRKMTGPVLRTYTWERPAVSFGYFEKFAPVITAHPGRECVRRWTGGGVVPHGQDFTYSLLVPTGEPVSRLPVAESYRLIHKAIATALSARGFDATTAGAAREKVSHACFENPVLHDVLLDGRKIAGAAQRRTRFGLLHQGSIQIALSGAFPQTLAVHLSRELTAFDMSRQRVAEADKIAECKYATPAWTERV